jgi:hypothetical protein
LFTAGAFDLPHDKNIVNQILKCIVVTEYEKHSEKCKLVKGMKIDKDTNTSDIARLKLIEKWS